MSGCPPSRPRSRPAASPPVSVLPPVSRSRPAGLTSPPIVRSASATKRSALSRARRTISSGQPAPPTDRRSRRRLGGPARACAPATVGLAPLDAPPVRRRSVRRRTRSPRPPPARRACPRDRAPRAPGVLSMRRAISYSSTPSRARAERQQLADESDREELHADDDDQVGEHEQRPGADRLTEDLHDREIDVDAHADRDHQRARGRRRGAAAGAGSAPGRGR